MTTLVTGGTGFIGSHVVKQLVEAGRRVRVLTLPSESTENLHGLDIEQVEGDVLDVASLERALQGCDRVFHLAAVYALWLPDPAFMYRVNVEGTANVLWACFRRGIERIVYTSSIAALGVAEGKQLSDESTEFNCWRDANDYIRSKWLAEQEALRFAQNGLPLVIVNPCFPLGSGDIRPTPTGRIIEEILTGGVPGLMRGGLNVVSVHDVARGHLLAEEKGEIGERYILGQHNVTWKELVEQVAAAAEVKPPRLYLPSSVMAGLGLVWEKLADHLTHETPKLTYSSVRYARKYLFYDTSRAVTELGLPRTPLDRIIEEAVAWFRGRLALTA